MDKNLLSSILKYEIQNIDLFKEALTHKSTGNKNKNNERLEFLGDAVLELIVTEYLYDNYKNYNEGFLTSIRAALVKTESLAEECKRLNIDKLIILSQGEEKSGGRNKIHILADTFEAIIGAIYEDNKNDVNIQIKRLKYFIYDNLLYKTEDIIRKRKNLDPKTVLQEKSQEVFKETPKYYLISSEGPDHSKIFTMSLVIKNKELTIGKGKSKQEAEQNAAKIALKNWNTIKKFLLTHLN